MMGLGRHGVCVTLLVLLGLASCAQPIGPTVQVLPPQGKAYAAFEADERECSLHTNDVVRPLVNRSAEAQLGTAAVGTLLGAGLGAAIGGGRGAGIGAAAGAVGGAGVGTDQAASAEARIQQTYDNTYAACMVAHGNLVTAPPVPQTVVVAPAPVIIQPAPYVVTPAPYVVQPAYPAPPAQ
jgi:outer membrane lipoprotein SlyB